ncbi:MAG: metal ABC transporter substrate-binding protein [Burkholderiales bacterium]|nr:metal ABC transporter substrate-binding protein [Burkholderiales bacterium]
MLHLARSCLLTICTACAMLVSACGEQQSATPVQTPEHTSAATGKIQVLATFSILADITREIGGERVQVDSLVAANQDAHVFAPTPQDVKKLTQAQVLVSNGLGFEGWLERLAQSGQFKGERIVATDGIQALPKPNHGEMEHDHTHDHEAQFDPHAWHDPTIVQTIYVRNIVAGLSQADPAGADYYQKRGQAYSAQITQLTANIQKEVANIPPEQRKVVTSHDAFNYFAHAFGITFLAPQGVSTESESSAKAIAQLSTQIKNEHIKALFFENISNPKMMQQLTQETGVKIGGKLYSDALSNADEPASTYLKMMEYNANTLVDGMK